MASLKRQFFGEFRLLARLKALAVPQPTFLNSPKIVTFRPFVRNAQLPFIGATLPVFRSAADRLSPLFKQLAPFALNHPHLVERRTYSLCDWVARAAG
jgi:hypothetical protein